VTTANIHDLQFLARALGGEVNGNGVLAPGPGHSPQDRSLSVTPDENAPDGFLVHSFAGDDPLLCKDHVREKAGLGDCDKDANRKNGSGKPWTVISEYVYRDEHDELYLKVRKCRDGGGKKQFPQYHWDGSGWAKGKPRGPKLPYRLPELIAALDTATIWFCEGEKDADALAELGFVASTASEGAAAKWDPELTKWFKGRHVTILPDADRRGRAHAQKVAKAINSVAASVRVLDLFPDRHDGSDVSDWLVADTAGVKLTKLAKEAPLWEPTTDGDNADSHGDTSASDDALIAELAALSRLVYAKRRRRAAKQLGITASELDCIVAEMRGASEDKEPEQVLYLHWNVEPWHELVDGGALLRALTEALDRYIVMSQHQALVVALWIILTWLHEQIVVHSPILLATSPLPNSGKTTLLKLVSFLVRNGLSSVSITGPALFRSIDKWAPTIAIDEADTAFINNDDLKDVVNSGWTRGDCIIRCDPDTHDPRPYSTFCPKAIGMVGRKLPPATLSRCLMIAMRRKRPDEHADDFDHIDNDHFAQLRAQLLRWTTDNAETLAKAEPEMPSGLYNRTRMNWRLLLAIAERCGWKQAAWEAARAIEEVHAAADPELRVQLLSDIRGAFNRHGTDEVMTKTLLAELASDEEGPWLSYGKAGKAITDRQLARLLKPFGVSSETVHPPGRPHAKGYKRSSFEDAWASYLPAQNSSSLPDGASEACKRASADETGISNDFPSVRERGPHGSKNADFSYSHAGLHACTDRPPLARKNTKTVLDISL
jgi:5S rRNA maturation endonuclease (ribonuclease M5)